MFVQDVGGGRPVVVQAGDLPLWGMQIDVAAAADEIRGIGREADGGVSAADEFLSGIGLGAVAEQLKDLRLSAPSVHLCPANTSLDHSQGLLGALLGVSAVGNACGACCCELLLQR